MRDNEHPARRATRYHWAAGKNPLHWGTATAGWLATAATGVMAAGGNDLLGGVSAVLAIGSLAWSGLWLVVLPNNKRFKRAVDAKFNAEFKKDFDYQQQELISTILPDLHTKVDNIRRIRNKARKVLSDKFGEHDLFARDNLEKLDTLAISYLQLLATLSEYDEYLSLVDPEGIVHELEAALKQAEEADTVLKQARQRQVELLKNRLLRYQRAQDRMQLISAQCRNVETTMKLIIDQAMTTVDPQRVGKDIDQVLHNIEDSEVLTSELATYDDLEREMDDLRGRELE